MEVSLKRDTAENINATEKKDGQILFETDLGTENKIYCDEQGTDEINRRQYGGFYTVDSELDRTSTNPVENNVVNSALHNTQDNIDLLTNNILETKNNIIDLDERVKGSKILWQRNKVNDEAGKLTKQYDLKEKISEQDNGIIIIFSAMREEKRNISIQNVAPLCYVPKNYGFICEFIPKNILDIVGSSYGFSFELFEDNQFRWSGTALRYVYVYDDKLVDNDKNFLTPKATKDSWEEDYKFSPGTGKNNISYANNFYCIRYILGV